MGANVLAALFSERESHAVDFLTEQELTRLDVINFITHGLFKKDCFASEKWSIEDIVARLLSQIEDRAAFSAPTLGNRPSLQEVQEVLETLRLDVNWAWQVSESIVRFAGGDRRTYWVNQTVEELRRLAESGTQQGAKRAYSNSVEFDPLDQTRLPRPLNTFIQARHVNPVEVTIAVAVGGVTLLMVASMWSLRLWKRASAEEQISNAKALLLKQIARQIRCDDVGQLREIETLVLGLLNTPSGFQGQGEEVSISVPHLLQARLGMGVEQRRR
jgi:hypothetical protein